MAIEAIAVFAGLCTLLILGVPIAVSLGMTAILTLALVGNQAALLAFPQKLFVGADSFPLLAIIFFMIAGELMLQGGISKRLITMAKCFLYGLRGSLALITFVASAFFGALSGSGMATTAAIGKIMYPEMKRDGTYEEGFALSISAVGGTLGPMIPPSIALVVYGSLTNTSIGDLFIATIVPALLTCAMFCLTGYFIIKKREMATNLVKPDKGIIAAFLDGIWALITPLIILGGIYSGIFSPTEAAAVSCAYALIIGVFVYKELNWQTLYKALKDAAIGTSAIMFLICCATYFGWVITLEGIPQFITGAAMNVVNDKIVFLMIVNVVFLIAGMFVDIFTVMLLTIPLILPIATHLGIDLVHFGVVANINLGLGLITPPFGACLFVASSIDRSVTLETIYKGVIPFVIAAFIGVLIISYVPALSLWFK
ncbi:MAG: TRAP transporter large permease [Bacillota bacterium]|jgi:C4-dicarboxylate transporter DctM subunit